MSFGCPFLAPKHLLTRVSVESAATATSCHAGALPGARALPHLRITTPLGSWVRVPLCAIRFGPNQWVTVGFRSASTKERGQRWLSLTQSSLPGRRKSTRKS